MSINVREYIEELNRNYNSLGEDLLMFESLLTVREGEKLEGCAAAALKRVQGYTVQHMEEIDLLTHCLVREGTGTAPQGWTKTTQ